VYAAAFYILIKSAFVGKGVLNLSKMHGVTTIKKNVVLFIFKLFMYLYIYRTRSSSIICEVVACTLTWHIIMQNLGFLPMSSSCVNCEGSAS
jgi:hypothetical protein